MKKKNYKYLLYFIAATITATIAIQVYWNIQNYNTNKARLINEVQISLDNSVEAYYSDLAKTDFFSYVEERDTTSSTVISSEMFHFMEKIDLDRIGREIDNINDSNETENLVSFSQIIDTTDKAIYSKGSVEGITIIRGKNAVDSVESISGLVNRLTFSITRDSIDFEKLDSILKNELIRKKISIKYGLRHFKRDSVFENFETQPLKGQLLSTLSKSTYLPLDQKLQLQYSNSTIDILKRSLAGILLSFLLSVCTVACLFYLLHIINKQKELAEIKNDLISNITHEFKTPIATVSTAIEGIKNFNANNDKAKTDSYLDISQQQMKKLHLMVEKLLETATLDSDKLIIQKEEVDAVLMLKGLVDKYQMLAADKKIQFKSNEDSLILHVDPFHFENAVANIIDNAIKYGGNTIIVNLSSLLNSSEITIADDGGKIDKNQRTKIFDKFYRVPTGNRHDVKGFGIGLFYSKKIIDKHEGQLTLVPDAHNTIFKITL